MNDVVFNPESWKNASKDLSGVREAFYTSAHDVVVARTLDSGGSSPVDQAAIGHDDALNIQWYELVGNVTEQLNSDASKMDATGANYDAMEESGTSAVDRFWSGS